jgi:hypothetical protein
MPRTAGPGHQIRKGGKQLFAFDLSVLEDSTRKVCGIATGPDLDRENETVLKAAIANALPDFMMLPIMHLDHTERPVGWFTKAEFHGDDLYVEACVKPTADCDEFWQDVRNASADGKPFQFSIFGDRVSCTPSCALHPDDPKRHAEPCITKALKLYSISICQPGTAINPNTFAEVMKAMAIREKGHSQGLRKATDSGSELIHPTTDGTYPKKDGNMEKTDDENEKSPGETQPPVKDASDGPQEEKTNDRDDQGAEDRAGENGDMQPVIDLLTQVVERLQSLESSLGLYKSETKPGNDDEEKPGENPDNKDNDADDKEQVRKCPLKPAQKAATVTDTTITKAVIGMIEKAEGRMTEIEKRLDKIEKSTAKGPEVILVDPVMNKAMEQTAAKDGANPIVKSAGAEQLSNFEKLFHGR